MFLALQVLLAFLLLFFIFENTFLINITKLQNSVHPFHSTFTLIQNIHCMLDRHLKVYIINLRKFLFNVQLTIYAWSSISNCNIWILSNFKGGGIYLIEFLFHSHCTNEFYHPIFFTISSLHIHVHVHTDKIRVHTSTFIYMSVIWLLN